ncbi:hypothetical protein H0H81_000350, partial [Sphagnurus paluster]
MASNQFNDIHDHANEIRSSVLTPQKAASKAHIKVAIDAKHPSTLKLLFNLGDEIQGTFNYAFYN